MIEPHKFPLSSKDRVSLCSPGYFALTFCLVLAIILVAYYLYLIGPYVLFPADILMWGETDFVGNIIKIRNGTPIYTPPEHSNSLIYTPGVSLLTYLISWFFGNTTSIATLRIIQLGYVTFAAIVASSCLKMLYKISFPDHVIKFPKTWYVLSFLIFFLTATSPRVNTFSHCLHLDALAILISMFCFWTMLRYLKSPGWGSLFLMAVCPALGYLIKQFLISWSALMFIFLLLLRPRDIKRLMKFTLLTIVFITVAMGSCYLLWGGNFIFWTFEVMAGRAKITVMPSFDRVSLVRCLDHVVSAWMELLIGFIGGCWILQKNNIQRLGPLFVAWIMLIASEAFSSGAGWGVLYHFGPGVLIGVVWLFVALIRFWPYAKEPLECSFPIYSYWTRPIVAVIGIVSLFVALHVVATADKK